MRLNLLIAAVSAVVCTADGGASSPLAEQTVGQVRHLPPGAQAGWCDELLVHGSRSRVHAELRQVTRDDRWFVPCLARMLDRADMSADAVTTMWALFPHAAAEVSKAHLGQCTPAVQLLIAQELSARGLADARAQGVLHQECQGLKPGKWGLMFVDGPTADGAVQYRVAHVCKASTAERAGLLAGDVVVAMNGRRVFGSERQDLLAKSLSLELRVARGPAFLSIRMARGRIPDPEDALDPQ